MATVHWPLEYALLFGVPSNKIEYWDGVSRWAFPFLDRAEAEAHFEHWRVQLARWKGVSPQSVRKGEKEWRNETGGITMTLYPRPIQLRVPLVFSAFEAFLDSFFWTGMWPGEWPLDHRFLHASMDHGDTQMNLWSLFGTLAKKHGGEHAGRVSVALSDSAAVDPDQFYFRADASECMINGDYFRGIPDLIVEVLSPASIHGDQGERKELYRRTGVPRLWLLHPAHESVQVFALRNRKYDPVATYRAGDTFEIDLFPGDAIRVDDLFKLQSKRFDDRKPLDPAPVPESIVAKDVVLGLEYFFLLGHPERRWEIWDNRCPSVLAFGSPGEAKARLGSFIEDASRWEGVTPPRASSLAEDTEQAEIGRFRLTRSGRHIRLDTAVDARKYRDLLSVWGRREAWDWGEE